MSAFQTVFADGSIVPGYSGEIILSEVDIPGYGPNNFMLTSNADNVWNTLDLPPGLWLVGGSNVGIYSTTRNSVIETFHADHNAIGSIHIQTAPSAGALTALHVTSNDPNGYIFPQSMRPYILLVPTTINFVMQPVWTTGSCCAYGVAMGIKLF